MARKKMIHLFVATIVVALVYTGWKTTARSAYESADYVTISTDGAFEIREYPDLMLATTQMRFKSRREDGSFMRLFRYISGANGNEQKVAMTTPVFMESENSGKEGQMGFVLPHKVALQGAPDPSDENVQIRKRSGGRFATIRFAGPTNAETFEDAERKLRQWMNDKGLDGESGAEFAGYDPPWTPAKLRRNEVLIRLKNLKTR